MSDTMTREEFSTAVQRWGIDAAAVVRLYARDRCAKVPRHELAAIVRALGDISVGEAIAALDRMQAEL